MKLAFAVSLLWSAQIARAAQENGKALLEQGKFDQVVAALEKSVARSPNDSKARNLLGIALSRVGRQEAANEQFRKAVELNPGSIPSLKNLALSELTLGRLKESQLHFETVLRAAPKDPAAHLGMAEIEFALGRYVGAISHFNQSSGMYLHVPDYTLHYAQSCIESNQPAAALAALSKLPPSADAQIHFAAGVLLARLEQFEAAAQHFVLAESGLHDPYDAGYNLTLAYVKSKQPARAIQAGEKLLALGYKKAELYNLLSQAYEQNGQTKQAYDALRTATELEPADESNYLDLMALCLDHQNWDVSLEIADVALARLPQSYRLHLQRGAVLAMKTKFEEAEKEFLAATQAAPGIALPHVALALVKMQINKLDEAIELLRERRKAGPSDYLVNWFFAEAMNRKGVPPSSAEEKEAVEALRQAVKTNPQAEQARLLLGKFLIKRGETDLAIEQFTKAAELDPSDSSATYQLAHAYRKRGDVKRAAELFAKVSQDKAEAREQFTQRNLVRIIRDGMR